MTEMTVKQAFEHAGLEAKETRWSFYNAPCAWEVKNAKGIVFKVREANWGQYTVDSPEKRLCTHCLFRTAVKLIKTN